MDLMREPAASFDIAIAGGGAAGLAAAIFAGRAAAGLRVAILDGAPRLGAKILVSGGGRCNVTNTVVRPEDFFGGSRHVVKRVLGAFNAARAAAFFREIGVSLHEEEDGKLFPDTNSARTVLNALLTEARRRGVQILTGRRVISVRRASDGFELDTPSGQVRCSRLALATGGLSLPKTGSDGGGYDLARLLGHSLVPTTPGLAPLILDGEFHRPLSGLTHQVALHLRAEGEKPSSFLGSLLWTHFGVSGPVVLNASRFWHRAEAEGRPCLLSCSFLPDHDFARLDQALVELAAAQPRVQLHNALGRLLPARLAGAVLAAIGIAPQVTLAHLGREERRRLVAALLEWPLPVRDSRGYAYAEVTAGGVPLTEIDPGTMESRACPGLHLVGEILDVDGRIGGFNFQWAWSSGFAAGRAMARALSQDATAVRHER
jgi:predicted Rossmann fold flavoprotein